MTKLKVYTIVAVVVVALVGFVGKCVYDWGYEDCNDEWIASTKQAKDIADKEAQNEYNQLQKDLAEAYERGVLAGYDQRLREYEQMRAGRGVETTCHDRDAVLKLAIDQEKALGEAIEFLRVERKR